CARSIGYSNYYFDYW
nr:immunoglobulin heavy chain junction region [Mus musculus]